MLSLPRLTALGAALALAAALAPPTAQAALMPLQHASTAVADVPNDGVIAPGDVLTIREALKNTSGSTLTGLSGTLTSSTPGVPVTQGASSYPDIVAGDTQQNTTAFTVSVSSSLMCGTAINLSLALASGGDTATVPLTLATGVTGPLTSYTGNPVVIGDATPTLRPHLSAYTSSATGPVATAGIVRAVQVNIGDL